MAKLPKELEMDDEKLKVKVLNQPQMINGVILTSALSQEDFKEVIIKKLA